MSEPAAHFYDFDVFSIDVRRRVLTRNGAPVALTPKVFDTLLVLVAHAGEVVRKDRILSDVWPDTAVEEGNLTVNVSILRRLLGETPTDHRFIVTVPGSGYRFVAPVSCRQADAVAESVLAAALRFALVSLALAVGVAIIWQAQAGPDPHKSERDSQLRALYLRGQFFLTKRTREGLRRGLTYFDQALQLDPEYAPAYAGRADAYNMLGYFRFIPPAQARALAQDSVSAALRRDPDLAEAHAALGYLKHRFDWDWRGAEASFRRAIAADPSCAAAHHWYAAFLESMGRDAEAIEEARRAESLAPQNLVIAANLVMLLQNGRRPDLALRQTRELLQMDPNFWPAHWSVAETYARRRQFAEAIAEQERAASLAGRSPHILSGLGEMYALGGRIADALAILDELDALSRHEYVSPYDRVPILAALGRRELAFAWLDRAYAERSTPLAFLGPARALPQLRNDARFTSLLARVGLTADQRAEAH